MNSRRISRRSFLTGAVATGAACAVGCGFRRRKRPNLLLITSDTTRSRSLGCYGHPRAPMPLVDRWAREGVLFERSYSVTNRTLPGHASIMTGLFPDRHGVMSNRACLPSRIPTLAEILRPLGYVTAAFVGVKSLDQPTGVARGFGRLDWNDAHCHPETPLWRRSGTYLGSVIAFLKEQKRGSSPFFLWLHSFDPHTPFLPPGRFAVLHQTAGMEKTDLVRWVKERGEGATLGYHPELPRRYMESQYLGELSYWDSKLAHLDEVLQEGGNLADTLVVFTADHGESIGEGGCYGHAFINQEVVRIPLVMHHPDGLPARRVDTPVHQCDLAPTLLSLLGVPYPPEAFEGIDLGPWIRGEREADLGRPIYLINSDYIAAAVVDHAAWKKVRCKPCHGQPFLSPEDLQPELPQGFTDNIVENRSVWLLEHEPPNLRWPYWARLPEELEPHRLIRVDQELMSSGEIRVELNELERREDRFVMLWDLMYERRTDPFGQGLLLEACLLREPNRLRYALVGFDREGAVRFETPWICYQVSDHRGVSRPLGESLEPRIIDLRSDREVELGEPHRVEADPGGLLDRLDRFLARTDPRRMEPHRQTSGHLLLPGRPEDRRRTPREITRLNSLLSGSAQDEDARQEKREELRSLGY